MSRVKITVIAGAIQILIGYAAVGSAVEQVPASISNPRGVTREACAIAATDSERCRKMTVAEGAWASRKCEDGLNLQQRRCMLEVLEQSRSDYRRSTGEQTATPKN